MFIDTCPEYFSRTVNGVVGRRKAGHPFCFAMKASSNPLMPTYNKHVSMPIDRKTGFALVVIAIIGTWFALLLRLARPPGA